MSIDLDAVRVFVKVAELASFTRAAEQLGLSKARVSTRVRELERDLGGPLLQRSTRAVRVTPDGEQVLARARRLLDDADALSGLLRGPSALRGRVRVDTPQHLARSLFIPRLPALLAAHPQLELMLSTTDRRVDLIREGFDCVLRIGRLDDSGLVAQRLGELPMVTCASPAYLARHGIPRTLAELDHHVVVHYAVGFGADPPSFDYRVGPVDHARPMRSVVTVNSTDSYQAACLAGLGLIQAPRLGLDGELASGDLVEVLPQLACAPLPVSLVHAHGRQVPRRVRAVMTWLAALVRPHLA
ncbi:MAG: LysR family transcriptional regulator [Kofleriaceae bacterium]